MQVDEGSRAGFQAEINVTPLVDVVLVLLIIFMVIVPLALHGHDVDVPRTSATAPPADHGEEQVILSIEPSTCRILEPPGGDGWPTDCRVRLGNDDIPVSALPARAAEIFARRPPDRRVLLLAADDRLNYEGVVRIVDLARSGVDDLTIGVIVAE
jgi:biopolymer transport protein ExbD